MAEEGGALVLYSEYNPFVDGLRLPTRSIRIGGAAFDMRQHWAADGKGGTPGIGFGASVYDASIVLADYCVRWLQPLCRAANVLELGCGLGLVSLAAAHAGARRVIATDGDDLVVSYACENIDRNGSPHGVSAQRLLWDSDDDFAAVMRTLAADTSGSAPAHFDIILASDIIACPYATAFGALASLLRRLLRPAPTVAHGDTDAPRRRPVLLLAYQRRHFTDDEWFDMMRTWCTIQEVPAVDLHPDFAVRTPPIQVFRIEARDDADAAAP